MVGLYLDHNVRRAIAIGLRKRGVDVVTALEDQHAASRDDVVLVRTTELGRVLFSHDDDLLAITAQWLRVGRRFAGLAFAQQTEITVAEAIRDLELLAKTSELAMTENQVVFLPLRNRHH